MASAVPELSVVIPMFNERHRIGPTLDAVRTGLDEPGLTAEIILVDDGSTDGTADIVEPHLHDHPRGPIARTVLLRLDRNRGKGAAVRTGLHAARGDHHLMMDADGSNDVRDVRTLLDAARTAGADLAIGSRAMPGVRLEARATRRLAGYCFRGALRLLGVGGYRDTQCGFKLYSARAARLIGAHGEEDRFAFDIEHILLCERAGLGVVEVGVPWTHRDGSKVNVVSDGLKMLADVRRIRVRVRTLDVAVPAEPPADDPEPDAGRAAAQVVVPRRAAAPASELRAARS